jgi:hypothetical protein
LVISATMISSYPIEEVIRGRLGTIKFVKGGYQIIRDDPDNAAGRPRLGIIRSGAGRHYLTESDVAEMRDDLTAWLDAPRLAASAQAKIIFFMGMVLH